MPKKRRISDIKSNLLRPALTSNFEVSIAPPGELLSRLNIVNQDKLILQCCEASLPGSSLATFEINNDHHGVTERHAYRRIFDDRIDLTFYVDADNYLPIRFFESWIRYIVDENDTAEEKGTNRSSANYHYRVRYPEGNDNSYSNTNLGYRTKIEIVKFERDYINNLRYTFLKAYPLSISSMPISYDSSSLLKCTVGFTYIRYYIDELDYSKQAPDAGDANDGGGSLPLGNPDINTALQDSQVGNTNAEDRRLIPTDNSTGFRGQLLEPLRDAAGNIVSDLLGNRL